MLYHHIKISLRNIIKHRFFSLLNIVGLALGMACCLTVILIIRDQLSYDRFQPNVESVYRISCQQTDGRKLASVPYPLGETLLNDFSFCESSVRLVRSIQEVDALTANNLSLPLSGFYTEPSFFQMFGFRLEAGSEATALSKPNSIVLSKEMAVRLFDNINPLGEMLTLKDKGTYQITGVVATPLGKTHLNFDCLASVSSLKVLEQSLEAEDAGGKVLENWENRYASYVYMLLKPGHQKTELTDALNAVAENRDKAEKADKGLRYFAQNLGDITPRTERLANEISGGMPWSFIWGMVIFVLVLTIFPCLNYANMAISRSLSRTKEIGVRKSMGARPADVKHLILTEAIVSAFFALLLACYLHLPLNQFVKNYFPAKHQLDLHAQGFDWIIFIGFGLIVGILAGCLPAIHLAKIHPVLALKGNPGKVSAFTKRFGWRKIMLVGQFSLSLIFLIVVTTLWSQMKYMSVVDYGFQKENMLTIRLQDNNAKVVADEMVKDPHVTGVCTSSSELMGNTLYGITLQKEEGEDPIWVNSISVNENYVSVMDLKLIAGENFSKGKSPNNHHAMIVNEKALDRFDLGSADEAVGKVLWKDDKIPIRICGVVQDFHYRSLEHGIDAFALSFSPTENGELLHVRLSPGDPSVAMTSLASIWKKIDPVHLFDAEFMDEAIQNSYSYLTLVGSIISFLGLIAVLLACMGLLGTVTYTVSTKVKEISIRKVLGASAIGVTFLLSRQFLMLLGIAICIALPVGYFLSNLFLNLFVYHISVDGMILGGSILALLFLGLLTIGVQVGRAALANPVESLRSE